MTKHVWACGSLAAAAALGAHADTPGLAASIRANGGAPKLVVNGRPRAPLIFFFNLQAMPAVKAAERYMREQVALASRAGVHLYSVPLTWPRKPDGRPDIEWADRQVDLILDLDPDALLILRLFPGMPWTWHEWRDVPPDDQALFADGSRAPMSAGSDLFWAPTDRSMARMIRHYEGARYGRRILGYHLGGPDSENFHVQYREKGPDLCSANQSRFRRWLAGRYRSDAELTRAWGRPSALATASIPRPEPGRFPMHSVGWRGPVTAFYDLPRQQDWVDFSTYNSDLMADRIIDWARLVKRETRGRKLSVFFYGYTFELPGSFSGHDALQRVLACPDVDVLVSPYAYGDRGAGGTGAFMAPVDSVAAHGKLWLNEDDTRTHRIRRDELPPWWSTQDVFTADARETLGVLGRNVASVLTHRAGTWWMDLGALGAFGDPGSWEMLAARKPLFEQVAGAYRPDCALIVDERSRQFVRDDWDVNCWTLMRTRDEMARCGATVGLYTLTDFVAGRAPKCRLVVFANPWAITDAEAAGIRARLDRDGGTAVWRFAPAYIGPSGASAERAGRTVGIALIDAPGRHGSRGAGLLTGRSWGPDYEVHPRLAVADAAADTIGFYASDGRVSAAAKQVGRRRAVFIGDLGVSADVLRRLAEEAGAHIWVRDGSVVHSDGRTLAVHCASDGEAVVRLPACVRAIPLDGRRVAHEGAVVRTTARKGDTLWFALQPDRGRRPSPP